MPNVSPCWVTRPINTALTCSDCPIFCGSSSFPLNLKTVLRAITLRSGICESVLIRLSVRPSLRYSLPASAVAFTKGSTAMELIFLLSSLRPRRKEAARKAGASTMTAIAPEIKYLRLDLGGVAESGAPMAAGIEDQLASCGASDDAGALG